MALVFRPQGLELGAEVGITLPGRSEITRCVVEDDGITPGASPRLVVGPVVAGAPYQTIEDARDAAVADGLATAEITVLSNNGVPYVENVDLPQGYSLKGKSNGLGETTVIIGNVTCAGDVALRDCSITAIRVEGNIIFAGTANSCSLYLENVSTAGTVQATNSGSNALVNIRDCELENRAAGLVYDSTGPELIAVGTYFRTDQNVIAIQSTVGMRLDECRVEGFTVQASGIHDATGCTFTADGIPVVCFAAAFAFWISNFSSNNLGGDAIDPPPGLFVYGGCTQGFGTNLDSTMGTPLAIDGVPLQKDPALASDALFGDGLYKAVGPGAGGKIQLWASLAGTASFTTGQMQIFNVNNGNPGGVLDQTQNGVGINNADINPFYMPACTLVKAGISYAGCAVSGGIFDPGGAIALFNLYENLYSSRNLLTGIEFLCPSGGVFGNASGNDFQTGIIGSSPDFPLAIPEGTLLGLEFQNVAGSGDTTIVSMRGMYVYMEFDLT